MDVRRQGAIAGAGALAAIGALAALALALIPAAGCGTDPVGVDVCRQVEEARCRKAPECMIPLEPPYVTTGTDVDGCLRFYDEQCRHGLVAGDPGAEKANACVAAIQADSPATNCKIVGSPETSAACSWLVPPAAVVVVDAGPDGADATDGNATSD